MGWVRVLRQETQRVLSPSWCHVMILFCNLEEGSRQNLIVKIIILPPLTQTSSLLIWENSISTVFGSLNVLWALPWQIFLRNMWGLSSCHSCSSAQSTVVFLLPWKVLDQLFFNNYRWFLGKSPDSLQLVAALFSPYLLSLTRIAYLFECSHLAVILVGKDLYLLALNPQGLL